MATIKKETRELIVTQALKEIEFARRYKQGKISGWKINEDLYFGKKVKSTESRANVDLGQMQSFVHTLLSKIDSSLDITYVKRKNSQYKRVMRLNALKDFEKKRDYWDIKDLVGKKQAIIYGRAIYAYYASSGDGEYKSHLDPVDVYDFLIDPSAGGIDIERAMYLGRYGITKSEEDLKQGVKDKNYLAREVNELIAGNGNMTEKIQEDTNKENRDYGSGMTLANKEVGDDDQYKFWEWFTTYKGTRYYLLLSPSGSTAIKVIPLKEMFESEMWPFWTWACFPDLTEFWTPSFCDYVKDPIMAQSVSINQLLDNAERINKPQRLVNTTMLENLAELKWRKDGYIRVKNDVDPDKAYKIIETPSLQTPLDVYEILESIQEKNSGVTAGAKGVADGDAKATIYEGNQANTADRFGLLNKSYAFGYERLGKLFEVGVREHLSQKIAIEILGPDGVEIKEVDKDDIFADENDTFAISVESTAAETALSVIEKKTKLNFLQTVSQSDKINQTKSIEMQAKIAGFDDEDIRQLLEVNEFGSMEIMSEADRDIERVLEGEEIQPNAAANTAYQQRIVDYMKDNKEDITDEQFAGLVVYLQAVSPIVMENMAQRLREQAMKAMENQGQVAPEAGGSNRMSAPKDVMDTTAEETLISQINQV